MRKKHGGTFQGLGSSRQRRNSPSKKGLGRDGPAPLRSPLLDALAVACGFSTRARTNVRSKEPRTSNQMTKGSRIIRRSSENEKKNKSFTDDARNRVVEEVNSNPIGNLKQLHSDLNLKCC